MITLLGISNKDNLTILDIEVDGTAWKDVCAYPAGVGLQDYVDVNHDRYLEDIESAKDSYTGSDIHTDMDGQTIEIPISMEKHLSRFYSETHINPSYIVELGSIRAKNNDDYIQEKINELANLRYDELIADYVYDGNPYLATRESSLIINMASALGQSRRWKTSDNNFIELSAQDLQTLATGINNRMQALYDKESTVMDLIKASDNAKNFDVISAWDEL